MMMNDQVASADDDEDYEDDDHYCSDWYLHDLNVCDCVCWLVFLLKLKR